MSDQATTFQAPTPMEAWRNYISEDNAVDTFDILMETVIQAVHGVQAQTRQNMDNIASLLQMAQEVHRASLLHAQRAA